MDARAGNLDDLSGDNLDEGVLTVGQLERLANALKGRRHGFNLLGLKNSALRIWSERY